MIFQKNALLGLRRILAKSLLAAAFGASVAELRAQPPSAADLLQGHRFVFIAEWAVASNGFRRRLLPTYELRVTSDSVEGRLPFYGRVYSPSEVYDMAKEGFTIRSRLKKYELHEKRRKRRELVLEPQPGSNVQKLTFTVFDDGSAVLFINAARRDAMSYEGRIAPSQMP